ncbi:adenylyl cyclase [Congregibacter brevis]|uniref:Adenylyl cyclase n=1 Tax=Congregibacter brevis TaxID=3081201 RepID=A0ABZ0IC66_9GAMM|nr:adenylyl cyclase [Congregibacter sp. IMCC45268]
MSFFGELKRRNVFRVAGLYVVVSWVIVQVAATVEEAIALPAWFDAVVLSFLVLVFPIVLIFAWAFELTPEGIQRTSAVDKEESITTQTASKLDIALLISFLMFAGALLAPRFLPERQTDTGDTAAADTALQVDEQLVSDATPPVKDASIAVLPFADLSPDGDQEYFADGISEELLNVLAQVDGMKVAGRTSSFAFKGRNEDLREIGQVLNVAHILEGSVRSQGDKVRVTAQLIQVSDGFHLWSQTYDRDLSDIFAVQDDIAQQILVALTDELMADAAPAIAPAARTDISAFNLFLQARDLIASRDASGMQRALELLNRAIEIDPTYAPAYASRAKAYTLLSDRPGSYGSIPAQEALTLARADVDKALALDPKLADGFAIQGLINADIGRPDFAVSSLRRALELNPNSLDARNWLALALAFNGRLRDVADQLKTLVDIDPLYPPGVTNTILYNYRIGDFETAKRVGERYIRANPGEFESIRIRSGLLMLDNQPAESILLQETLPLDKLDARTSGELRSSYYDLGIDAEYKGPHKLQPLFEPYGMESEGDLAGALNKARKAVADFPEYYAAHTVLIRALSQAEADEELAAHFAAAFDGSLETYATKLRPSVSVNPPPYGQLALALRAVGNTAEYEDAMQRWRFTIDMFRAGGDVSPGRDRDDAAYWAIVGDDEKSIDFLESAFSKGHPLDVFVFRDRVYKDLQLHPRFAALRRANLERVNEERAILNYPPLDESYYTGIEPETTPTD